MRTVRSLVLAVCLAAAPAAGETVVIESDKAGNDFDCIVDGFPGQFGARDGNPDSGGFPLSIALKGDVTESRSIVEFGLAPLAGLAAADVLSAVLTFNIDDVISQFSPDVVFGKNRAAAVLLVHLFAGNGDVTLADFNRTGEEPTAIETGIGITDQTLTNTGARVFTVDVRARLVQALGAGTTHLGVLWRTNESDTGTSIDDGGRYQGAPTDTSAGSRMPFLIVEVKAAPPAGCGNGTHDAGEECDDGNNANGDCCSRVCRLDAAGTACQDGNACTEPDACDGAGACLAGGPKACDDASICTADGCDPATGCGHVAVNEGATCDDGTVCTAGDVCAAGVCTGTPVSGSCDDGSACTSNDTCAAGRCVGTPLCGNGTVEPSCAEECDDGNTTGVDGCSASCRWDALLGGKGAKECLLRVAFEQPERAASGEIAATQSCTDGDACDGNPAAGVCGFITATCLGRPDPRLPSCTGAAQVKPTVAKPGRSRRERANRTRLGDALAATPIPGCSPPVAIDVPVRRKGGKVLAGRVKVVLKAKAPGLGRDTDTVVFVCRPGG
jgi:cysteine-rich repeat protein